MPEKEIFGIPKFFPFVKINSNNRHHCCRTIAMKNTLLLFALLVAGLSSCCTKKKCLELSSVEIKLQGFNAAETDTIEVTGYAHGSNFTNKTRDKHITQGYYQPDNVYIIMDNGDFLSDQYDWEVYIPAVKKTIRISGYGYNSYSCNNCPIDREDKIHTLSTCTVNGVITNANDVNVYR